MQLFYNNVDISNDVQISAAKMLDNAGGQADSVEVIFNDTKGLWSKWNPQPGDTIAISRGGLTSGIHIVDDISQDRGYYSVKGLSIPHNCKVKKNKSWENITLLQIATDIAGNYGYSLAAYSVVNAMYARVDQIAETDFAFLLRLCVLESCSLKISNRQVIIYSEPVFESKVPVKTISAADFKAPPQYRRRTQGLYSSCKVSYGTVFGSFSVGGMGGELLETNVYISSIGEAERFAKGLLRSKNKVEHSLKGTVELDTAITAACVVAVQGLGAADGIYFIDMATHDFINGSTFLSMRKRLEGGY